MKRYTLLLIASLISCISFSQTAKDVLEKAAQAISNTNGATATFTISNINNHTSEGSIAVKGKMFRTTMPAATVWFDGKTQWTYVINNDEVNINTPTEAELQAINPYSFLYIYRDGYSLSLQKATVNNIVTLKAKDSKRQIQELEITINKQTNIPSQIKMKQNNKWHTIVIKSFKKINLDDKIFRFNPQDYPNAEIIDLR